MNIITNNQPRYLLDFDELTDKEQEDIDISVDYWSEVDFVRYKGTVYNLDEFTVPSNASPDVLKAWDGFLSDSFFSGILVKWSEDGEQVIMGRYYD